VLDPVWRAFNWSWGFWQDAFINVAGFIPFGCFFCAYFSARKLRSPALCAAAFGAAVSVFIELTQANLPTRDSSMSDLINNILGSVLGAAAYRGAFAQAFDRMISWIVDAVNQLSSNLLQ
jgi:glycopeptide antibiotics resistance protein